MQIGPRADGQRAGENWKAHFWASDGDLGGLLSLHVSLSDGGVIFCRHADPMPKTDRIV